MRTNTLLSLFRAFGLGITVLLLAGCSGGILDPKGQVGAEEKHLILVATGLMLLVVIPVIFLTLYFAWKYRASNKDAAYEPRWSHSTKIELIVWLIPCTIILILGTIIWHSTHRLDPYRPLDHEKDHLTVEVVSLNWKWLFIYPEQNIATVNELVIPPDTPVAFKVTSQSTMNSFFIPQLGSQIYSMASMETKLHLIADEPGVYDGMSSNYSGGGFSGMHFKTIVPETDEGFEAWVRKVQGSEETLNDRAYRRLIPDSEQHPVEYFSSVEPGLFDKIVMQYMHGMEMTGNEHSDLPAHYQGTNDPGETRTEKMDGAMDHMQHMKHMQHDSGTHHSHSEAGE